jgi:hypothetical protein
MGYGCSRGTGSSSPASARAGSNVVESAAILMEFVAAPNERWAEFAKRLQETEHAGEPLQTASQMRAAARTRPPRSTTACLSYRVARPRQCLKPLKARSMTSRPRQACLS